MANILKVKRSSVQGKIPLTTDLDLGELAVNTYDGKLFLKKNVGGTETIVDVTVGADAATLLTMLKTVDGSGSGLDADFLEGMHALSTNTASSIVARDASGNFSAGTITAALSGNASTATTLQTARTINGISFNGSANITIADSTKLPLSGGTMTGAITFAAGQTWPTFNQNTTGSAATLTTGSTIGMTGDVTWTSAAFNGSGNVTGTATLANSGVTAGTYTKITVDAKGRATSGTTLAATDIPALDASKITTGVFDAARLPSYVDDVLEYTNLASFPTTGETGKIYVDLTTNKTYRWSGSVYVYITSGAVDSVAGKTGVVTLVKGDVGLGSVDNTSDAVKNVLSATKLTTARTINGVSFDGSANITLTATATNALTIGTGLSGTSYNGSAAVTIALATGYGDTQNPYASKTANYFLAAPNGTAGAPTFRAIVAADIPTLNQNTTGSAANISNTGTVTLATATESNSVYITAPSYTTDKPVKLLNFDWYGNIFSMGNIRSGATPSSGFGVYYTTGGAQTEIARFGTTGSFNTLGAITQNGSQVLTANNYNSYSPTLTGSGASGTWGINITGNAETVDSLHVHSGRNNEANKIVRTDVNGYIQCGYINSSNGDERNNSNPSYVWGTNGSDSYQRTYATSALSVSYATNAGSAYNYTQGFNSNWNTDFQNAPAGSTILRGDTSTGSSANGPGGTWWFQQNMRHTNSSNYWGVQVAWGWEDNANILKTRNVQGGSFGGWVTYLNSSNYSSYNSYGTLYTNDWFRSYNATGWYNQTFAVGIYATEAGNIRTYNGANFIAAGTITANSDERLKENWRPVQDNFVSKLSLVKSGIYDRIDLPIYKTQAGVSAQSLQKLLPEAILEDSEGILSVAYGSAAMVSVVELAKEVVSLKEELAELKKLINKGTL